VTILHVDSSISGEQSVSRLLSRSIVEGLLKSDPAARVVDRDLVTDPLPHLTLASFNDTQVLEEFLAADTVVIGAPMYNFTVPTQLKAWIDRLVIAGKTFRYTENGPTGLLGGKRVIVAIARGNDYRDGAPAAAFEHLQTYLRDVFGFLGLKPEFVTADGLGISPEQREASIANSLAEVDRLAA
jgi:FMN-dependent NADH-azoreductase